MDVTPIVMPLQLPPGTAGPEPVDVDVRAFLIRDGGRAILVDTGMQADGADLDTALTAADVGWADVSDIVLTHHHPDHIGALAHVVSRAPDAAVWSGDLLPQTTQVGDGDRIGPLRVLGTPGHTPGHICLVHDDTGDVFVGDCVGMFGGGLQHAPAAFTADVAEAQHSLHRLADVRGRRMYFAHGAEINDPWAALAALLDR
jgi:glyoxylase-like metal-dependent hydrolase (beta-lactamase superfamily II)